MKKTLTHSLRALALIMTVSLTAFAGHHQVIQPDVNNPTNTAATKSQGHPERQKEGHPN